MKALTHLVTCPTLIPSLSLLFHCNTSQWPLPSITLAYAPTDTDTNCPPHPHPPCPVLPHSLSTWVPLYICEFYNVCVELTFYCSLSLALHPSVISPLTVCYLPVCASPRSLPHLCSPIWDGIPESSPLCHHDLNIVCPLSMYIYLCWSSR